MSFSYIAHDVYNSILVLYFILFNSRDAIIYIKYDFSYKNTTFIKVKTTFNLR